MIYWFTGQPSHGKTVLATMLVNHYESLNKKMFHVDGDNLRQLTLNKDYSEQGRINNVMTAQKIAHYLHNEGYDVSVSLIAPYRWQREEFKEMLGENLIEFYVHTTDIREREKNKVHNYEPPLSNFIDLDTTIDSPKESFEKILKVIDEKLYCKGG